MALSVCELNNPIKMARFVALSVLLLIVFSGAASGQVGVCPRSQPVTATQSCTGDATCPAGQMCCPYSSSQRCVTPVIPNYQAHLYIAGLPQVTNENTYLANFIEQTFASAGVLGDLEIERLGSCVKIFFLLEVRNEATADTLLSTLERAPITLPNFPQGLFSITSYLNETMCPSAIPNFYTRLFIKNLDQNVTIRTVKEKLTSLFGNTGKGWEFNNQTMILTIGSCMEIYLEAVLTPQELTTVYNILMNLEQNGVTLNIMGKDVTYPVTSNVDEAAVCYQNYYQNDCGQGRRMCTSVKKCIPTSSLCDGVNDCGDFSDESDCTNLTAQGAVKPMLNKITTVPTARAQGEITEPIVVIRAETTATEPKLAISREARTESTTTHPWEATTNPIMARQGETTLATTARPREATTMPTKASAGETTSKLTTERPREIRTEPMRVTIRETTDQTTSEPIGLIPAETLSEFPDSVFADPGCDLTCADNKTQCLTRAMVCDEARDCDDHSDEIDCHFETFTFNATAGFPWNAALEDPGTAFYTMVVNAIKSFANNAFRPVPGFAYSSVLAFRPVSKNVQMTMALTFRGVMDAERTTTKMGEVQVSGIVSGLIHFNVLEIVPAKLGACSSYSCHEGLCVVTAEDNQPDCRCLPGQQSPDCAPYDCRGQKTYCVSSQNSSTCGFVRHLSSYACQCPEGWAGNTCNVSVCNQLGNTVCPTGSYCVGDLGNYTVCRCDALSFGPFCGSRFQPQFASFMCVKQREWANIMMDHLVGKAQAPAGFLNGKTLPGRLESLGYKNLAVPTCHPENGTYQHICIYNASNAKGDHFCYCTDPNGTYNGKDYVDSLCKVPDTFDAEAKPGVCPPASSGSVEFECLKDSHCQGNQKCCRLGVSRKCLPPLTGQWSDQNSSPLSTLTSARPLHHHAAAPPSGSLPPAARSLDTASSASSWKLSGASLCLFSNGCFLLALVFSFCVWLL